MLTVDNLSYRYPNGRKTLYQDLSISLNTGEIYGLMGQNGEGKTTLLKLMAGLIEPQKGKILWNSHPASGRPFLEELFFLPEESALPPFSLEKYMHLLAPLYPRFSLDYFHHVCNEFKLEMKKSMHKMSFGQKKKSLLAFGLATQTPLLMLDEPTNGLDVQSKTVLRKLLLEMQSNDRTIIISTHQARDLQEIISGLAILHNNKLVFNHTLAFMQQHLAISQSADDKAFYSAELGGLRQSLVAKSADHNSNHLDLEFVYLAATDDSGLLQSYLYNQALSETKEVE